MKFRDNVISEKGVTERVFDLEVSGHNVPGILWTPTDAKGPRPMVLLGHGGTQHKRAAHVLTLSRWFVRHANFAAAAIDAVGHGERAPEGQAPVIRAPESDRPSEAEMEERRIRSEKNRDIMIEDWKTTLDALQELDEIGKGPVGYYGVSMGTGYGLPFVAAEPRIKAVVFGLAAARNEETKKLAAKIQCPLMFVWQLDDRMTPESVYELVQAFGTKDKRLHANPGGHTEMPLDQFKTVERFLIERLTEAKDSKDNAQEGDHLFAQK